MTVTMMLIMFLALLVMGTPVAYVMYVVAGLFFFSNGIGLSVMVQKMGSSMNSITMVAIPMFIFAGTFMNHLNLTDSLFNSIMVTPVGRMKGGLAQVNVVASLVFAGMSGAALADIGGLGKIEIKAMVNSGYALEDATGITLASSTLGPIFPPSIPLMLYALYAEQSGIRMLMAGIVPALVLTVMLMVTVSMMARKKKWPVYSGPAGIKERLKIFSKGIPAALVPIILLGGMYSGKFASSELAAVCAFFALIISAVFYKGVNRKVFLDTAKESVSNIAAMMFICGAASLFAQVISRSGIPGLVQDFVGGLHMPAAAMLIVINIIFLIIGMFMDSNVAIMIFTPILLPALMSVGVDPVHFGVVVCLNVVIGIFTPPFGSALFLAQSITDLSFARIVKSMGPYLITLILGLLLVTLVPGLSTWLPDLIFG
ncbi:MAG: TRAP transporter large permease [Lachnospiraceae bacterium]|jgi:tripartite ATP-independent transporter DctM subunit|nr:TRAP transporter large permease [Lachnospiraceae bacterium]